MNKLFLFSLLALVAACAAAPSESAPLEPTEAATDLLAHEQDKRAIYYRTPGFGAYRTPGFGAYRNPGFGAYRTGAYRTGAYRTGYYPGHEYGYPSASYYPAGYNYPYSGSVGSSYLI